MEKIEFLASTGLTFLYVNKKFNNLSQEIKNVTKKSKN